MSDTKKQPSKKLSLSDLLFTDPEEIAIIPLKEDGSEWMKVKAARTDATKSVYWTVLTGVSGVDSDRFDNGFDVEFNVWDRNRATVQSRVVDWCITVKSSDGTSREFPFARDRVKDLNPTIVRYVAEQIEEMDTRFAATVTGTLDPNG